jgi:hypothetical protein
VRTRILASVAVAAAVALGATGCEFMTTADTQHIKDITDGINVNVGKLNIRNALFVSTNSGRNARFVATIVNSTGSAKELTVQAKDSTDHEATVRVPANTTLDLANAKSADEIVFRNVKVTPGDLTKVYFSYPSATGASAKIPVLTGAMAEYATLVPTTSPSPSSSSTAGTGASSENGNTPSGAATAPGTVATSGTGSNG